MNALKGYRTIIVAILVILIGAVQQDVVFVPLKYAPLFTQASGLLMLIMRLLTSTPPLEKPQPTSPADTGPVIGDTGERTPSP